MGKSLQQSEQAPQARPVSLCISSLMHAFCLVLSPACEASDITTRRLSFSEKEANHEGAIAPGVVATDMSNFTKTEAGRDYALGIQALKRIAQPDDISGAIAFLASDEARWVTGDTIRVDGGSKIRGVGSRPHSNWDRLSPPLIFRCER